MSATFNGASVWIEGLLVAARSMPRNGEEHGDAGQQFGEAFQALIAGYFRPRCRAAVRRTLGSASPRDREELVNDLLSTLWQRLLNKLDGNSTVQQFHRFVTTIIQGRITDELRRRKREHDRGIFEESTEPGDAGSVLDDIPAEQPPVARSLRLTRKGLRAIKGASARVRPKFLLRGVISLLTASQWRAIVVASEAGDETVRKLLATDEPDEALRAAYPGLCERADAMHAIPFAEWVDASDRERAEMSGLWSEDALRNAWDRHAWRLADDDCFDHF